MFGFSLRVALARGIFVANWVEGKSLAISCFNEKKNARSIRRQLYEHLEQSVANCVNGKSLAVFCFKKREEMPVVSVANYSIEH